MTRSSSLIRPVLRTQQIIPARQRPRFSSHHTTTTNNPPHKHATHPTTLHHTTTAPMADDTSYSTFLSKANEDPKSGARADTYNESTSQARSQFDPSASSTAAHGDSSSAIPRALHDLPDTPYVSDTDAAWEPVFFSYADDQPPTLEQFKQCLRAKSGFGERGAADQSVEELGLREFDPRGQYGEVVERVRKAGEEVGAGSRGNLEDGDKGVKVFRVEVSRTRVEYYVLTVGERKLLGVVAKAVES